MERSVRYSKKREAILAALQATTCHPSAEWLYRRLKPRHPDLSLGTVYRNLAFFQEHLPDICPDDGLDQAVSSQYGFAVERCELTFYGLCPSCLQQNQNLKEETQL